MMASFDGSGLVDLIVGVLKNRKKSTKLTIAGTVTFLVWVLTLYRVPVLLSDALLLAAAVLMVYAPYLRFIGK